jgi:hypothetical protein
MKFQEFFERSSEAKKASRILLLVGDDPLMKQVIVEHLGRLVGLWDVREQIEVGDVRSIVSVWEEGSLMGARFLDIRAKNKIKNNKLWKDFLARVTPGQNYMTVTFTGEGPEWGGVLARPIFQVIECRFPKTTKERTRLADLRLKTGGCKLDAEMVKELGGRVKSMAELESAVTTLTLLSKSMPKITEREITYVAGESENVSNTSRAILRGNTLALMEEMDKMEPILLLSIWHSTFKKLYCWMSQISGKDEPEEIMDESEEEGEAVQDDLQDMKVSRYQLKDYKIAKQRYSQPLIREIMEDINGIYQDIRKGRKEGWEERLRFVIGKIA